MLDNFNDSESYLILNKPMEFFNYLDTQFQNKSYQNSIQYRLKRDAEIQALHGLVNLERKLFRICYYVIHIVNYFIVSIGFKDEPVKAIPEPKRQVPDLKVAEPPAAPH